MLLSLTLACGGGGTSTFKGTVKGTALEVKSAILLANTEVWLSSSDKLCENLAMNTYPKDGRILKLTLRPVETGSFTVDPSTATGNTHTAFMQFFALDAACKSTIMFGDSVGTTGTVTVKSFEASKSIDGSFDLTFGSSDKVTGTFFGSYCDAPTTYPSPECK